MLLFVQSLLGSPVVAHAADQQQAAPPTDSVKQQVRQLIREAGQMMERGDRRGAAARLEQARALWNEPSIDYNLGVVYGELQQPQEAAQALERFLRNADRAMVLSERLEDAKKRLAAYERSLSRLSVTVTMPSGSSEPNLFLDGSLRSKLPDGNTPPPGYLFATAGSHQVRVASSGLRDYSVSVDLKAGELRKLDGILLPQSGDAALLSYSTPPQNAGSDTPPIYKRWWFWAAVGGGVAVIAGISGAAAAGAFHRVAPGSDLDPIDVSR
ncbi:MAG TPA: hypothetical protein PKL17_20555 [Pseudomonadota bacterium]|nr:hypothetical protein [Pseudomonadota bacterium]